MPIHAIDQGWALETWTTAYALGLNEAGLLAHRYWGARLKSPQDYPATPNPAPYAFNSSAQLTPEEYPGYEDVKFIDVCLKVTFAEGVRDVAVRFESAEVRAGDVPTLDIHLRDAVYPFRVILRYRVHETYDLIERSAAIVNDG